MKESIATKLDQLARRLEEVNRLFASEDATRDMAEFRRLSREHAEITPVVERFNEYKAAASDLAAAGEMLADPEMKAFGEAGARDAQERMARREADLQRLLLPKDPNTKNAQITVTARIERKGKLLFINDTIHRALSDGKPRHVDMQLKETGGPQAGDASRFSAYSCQARGQCTG